MDLYDSGSSDSSGSDNSSDSSGNWLTGLLSTARDVAGDIQSSDQARRNANAIEDLAKANAKKTDFSKFIPFALIGVVVLVLVIVLAGRK